MHFEVGENRRLRGEPNRLGNEATLSLKEDVMRRVLMISALLAGVMAFGSMPASAGVSGVVDVHFGHRGSVGYASGERGYVQDQAVYSDANDRCGDQGVRYGEMRWSARSRFGREQFQGRHGMHGNNGRGRGWDKRDGWDQGNRHGHGDGRWGDGD
jgi:hypothetical protein